VYVAWQEWNKSRQHYFTKWYFLPDSENTYRKEEIPLIVLIQVQLENNAIKRKIIWNKGLLSSNTVCTRSDIPNPQTRQPYTITVYLNNNNNNKNRWCPSTFKMRLACKKLREFLQFGYRWNDVPFKIRPDTSRRLTYWQHVISVRAKEYVVRLASELQAQ